jgi:hypothetical protein
MLEGRINFNGSSLALLLGGVGAEYVLDAYPAHPDPRTG